MWHNSNNMVAMGKKWKWNTCILNLNRLKTWIRKQDVHSEGKTHDIGKVTSIPNMDIETDNIHQETYEALIFVAQKRELNGKSPSNYTVEKRPQGSYASKKEPRRLEQGKGSSIIKFWKSLKQTVGLYDVAYGKTMPENVLAFHRVPVNVEVCFITSWGWRPHCI